MRGCPGLALGASVLAWAEEAEAAFGCHEDGLAAPISQSVQRHPHASSSGLRAAQELCQLSSGKPVGMTAKSLQYFQAYSA